MAWVNWSRKSTSDEQRDRTILGIDLNAGRARAATGNVSRNRVHLLDEPHPDLPLAISLEKRIVEIGRAGLALCRRLPHLACSGHLPYLGQPQEWKAGRHHLDAAAALSLIFARLRASCGSFEDIYLALPPYLTLPQVAKLTALAGKNRFSVKGTANSALALAANRAGSMLNNPAVEPQVREDGIVPLHRRGQPRLPADVVVVDADEHALSASLIRVETTQVRLLAATTLPRLGTKVWKERLLDSLSDRCVRACRRDPRDSADAEQSLYEQIDDSLDQLRGGHKVVLNIQCAHWYQDLILQIEDFENHCAGLNRQSVDGIRDLLSASTGPEPPQTVWLTHEAGRLPGLSRLLHQNMTERTAVGILRPEATSVAVANLGERWLSEGLPNMHLDSVIPIAMRTPDAKGQSGPLVKSVR